MKTVLTNERDGRYNCTSKNSVSVTKVKPYDINWCRTLTFGAVSETAK